MIPTLINHRPLHPPLLLFFFFFFFCFYKNLFLKLWTNLFFLLFSLFFFFFFVSGHFPPSSARRGRATSSRRHQQGARAPPPAHPGPRPPATMPSSFTGVLKIRVVEAQNLKLPDAAGNRLKSIDPYCVLNIDDTPIAKTEAKSKTLAPKWNKVGCLGAQAQQQRRRESRRKTREGEGYEGELLAEACRKSCGRGWRACRGHRRGAASGHRGSATARDRIGSDEVCMWGETKHRRRRKERRRR